MIEILLAAFIFITLIFLCMMYVPTSGRLTAFLCLIGSVALTFYCYKLATTTNHPTIYLGVAFVLLLLMLAAGLVVRKRKNKDASVVGFSIFYLVVMAIGSFIVNSMNQNDKAMTESRKQYENEVLSYKSLYNFNVDSLGLKIDINSFDKTTKELEKYIIAYVLIDGTLQYSYEFNKSLDGSLKSFNIDSINTIVVLNSRAIDVGLYSNGTTRAKKIETTVLFLDKRTLKTSFSRKLIGGSPPEHISYRHAAPESMSGPGPTQSEIIETINDALQTGRTTHNTGLGVMSAD